MKRCPQCLFIYPESDTRCDFDNTPLVAVDDAEIESVTNPAPEPPKKKRAAASKKPASAKSKKSSAAGSKKGSRKKGAAIVSAIALTLGLTGFSANYVLGQRGGEVAEIPPVVQMTNTPVAAPLVVIASSTPVESATPAPPPVTVSKTPSEQTATSHSRTTAAPVSTSGPGMGKKLGGKPVIVLTTGGKIDADEVWRTRDGVWYRRAGIVTLLKNNRVKTIVNQ
jgi:hypothetical protein